MKAIKFVLVQKEDEGLPGGPEYYIRRKGTRKLIDVCSDAHDALEALFDDAKKFVVCTRPLKGAEKYTLYMLDKRKQSEYDRDDLIRYLHPQTPNVWLCVEGLRKFWGRVPTNLYVKVDK